jgi:hypothetical protein
MKLTVAFRNCASAPKKIKCKTLCKQISIQGSQVGTMKAGIDAVHSGRKCANVPKDPSSRHPAGILRTNGTGLPNYKASHPVTLLPCLFGTRVLIRREQHHDFFGTFMNINSQQTTLQNVISAYLTRNSKLEDIQIQRKGTGKFKLQTL